MPVTRRAAGRSTPLAELDDNLEPDAFPSCSPSALKVYRKGVHWDIFGQDEDLSNSNENTRDNNHGCKPEDLFEESASSRKCAEGPGRHSLLPWQEREEKAQSSSAATYQRRKKDSVKELSEFSGGRLHAGVQDPALLHVQNSPGIRDRTTRHVRQDSGWLGRFLSRRRSSIAREVIHLPLGEELSSGDEGHDTDGDWGWESPEKTPNVQPKAAEAKASKLSSLPQDYVQRQTALFAEIDAFVLEEESPLASQTQDPDELKAVIDEPIIDIRRPWRPEHAVIEEETEDLLQSPANRQDVNENSEVSRKTSRLSLGAALGLLEPRAVRSTKPGSSFVEECEKAEPSEELNVKAQDLSARGLSRRLLRKKAEEPEPRRLFDESAAGLATRLADLALKPCDEQSSKETGHEKLLEADIDQSDTDLLQSCGRLAESSVEIGSPLGLLLQECRQTAPLSLADFLSSFFDLDSATKLGEGTYGEAFRGGDKCFKIVPMGGEIKVNGEIQKAIDEMYTEVLLTNTLSSLRDNPSSENTCEGFIKTYSIGVCKGQYASELIRAWEHWDSENTSENDHPLIFPEAQLYTVFAFADGGTDLERFTLKSFEEVKSLLVQVALTLAVAEEAVGFEHRDLHWGNLLLARKGEDCQMYRLKGHEISVPTAGLSVALIDFTLSRLEAGERVLFCDLSADPELFKGPAGNVQADTYRRMKKLAKGHWEKRLPQTNCLWLHYLVDIILSRKTFPCTSLQKHELKTLRKRVLGYKSALHFLSDECFEHLHLPKL